MRALVMAAAGVALSLAPAKAQPKVVVSIKPLHDIVAGIMDGIGTPRLLLPAGATPHSYSMRPSDARALRNANVVFWIGPTLESFLEKPLKVLARRARVVALSNARGLILHRVRAGGIWEKHGHGDENDGDKGHHRHKGHGDHQDHDDHRKPNRHKGHAASRARANLDGHLWLDPRNGQAFARAIAATLIKTDPANAARYQANLRTTLARINAADRQAAAILAPVRRRPYIVFHDAFQYFEKRYRLNGAGSITLEGRRPGARRLYQIRSLILKQRIRCVFTEPQFDAKLARTVIGGTKARMGTIDPIGKGPPSGKGAYGRLLVAAARSFARCLS